jgi:hypothetical protein
MAAERADPIAATVAARDEAGTFLNSGDFAGGLAVVDRAVVEAESTLRGRDRAFGLGIPHLRGLTYGEDADEHGTHFGPEQTATHVISTYSDMDQYRTALDTAEDLTGAARRFRPPVSAPRT